MKKYEKSKFAIELEDNLNLISQERVKGLRTKTKNLQKESRKCIRKIGRREDKKSKGEVLKETSYVLFPKLI